MLDMTLASHNVNVWIYGRGPSPNAGTAAFVYLSTSASVSSRDRANKPVHFTLILIFPLWLAGGPFPRAFPVPLTELIFFLHSPGDRGLCSRDCVHIDTICFRGIYCGILATNASNQFAQGFSADSIGTRRVAVFLRHIIVVARRMRVKKIALVVMPYAGKVSFSINYFRSEVAVFVLKTLADAFPFLIGHSSEAYRGTGIFKIRNVHSELGSVLECNDNWGFCELHISSSARRRAIPPGIPGSAHGTRGI